MQALAEAARETAITEALVAGNMGAPGCPLRPRAGALPRRGARLHQATQPETWAKLEALHGAKTGDQVLHDLCAWLDAHGALATLRHGFKCRGRTLRIAYFKAAHGLNAGASRSSPSNGVSTPQSTAVTRPRPCNVAVGRALTGTHCLHAAGGRSCRLVCHNLPWFPVLHRTV